MTPWKVLIVDDEEGIHGITRMIFRGYEFEQRPIELISAMSRQEAEDILQKQPDITLAILDVVMEQDNAGLLLVEYIRNHLNNQDMRIILRTGHPGYAPEAQVVVNYDINDYLSKAELSASRLLTSVVVALRSYRDIKTARKHNVEAPHSTKDNDRVLHAAVAQLKALSKPIQRNSQRLRLMDLNPVAKDLCCSLDDQQHRLNLTLNLLEQTQLKHTPDEGINTTALLDELLQIFLPQSRKEGWLIDYQVDQDCHQLKGTKTSLHQLLFCATELAILQAKGEDLKVRVYPHDNQKQYIVSIELLAGYSQISLSPWGQFLAAQLTAICEQLDGFYHGIEDNGAIRCLLPLTAIN